MTVSLKLGIIGAGNIVESNHLPVLLNLPGITVSWIYDKNPKRAGLLSEMFRLQTVDQWDQEVSNIDICLLTIPYGVRSGYMELLGQKNKSVYVEKPFALSVAEHLKWGELFQDSKLAVGFQRRYYRVVHELKDLLGSGILGELKKVQFRQGSFSLKGGTGYLSNAGLSGGGVVVESSIHYLDQILFITGALDVKVMSVECIHRKGIDYDTKFTSELTLQSGTIEVESHVSTLQNLDNGLELYFENGVVTTSLSVDGKILIWRDYRRSGFEIHNYCDKNRNSSTSVMGAFGEFWRSFIESVQTGKPNETSYKSSVLTTKWIQGIYGEIRD